MYAITVRQPYASMLVFKPDVKRYETRSWWPPSVVNRDIGQRVAIHAAKVIDKDAPDVPDDVPKPLPLGVVLATATLTDVLRVTKYEHDGTAWIATAHSVAQGRDTIVKAIESKWSDMADGRYLWQFDDIEPITPPVPMTGHLGLWHFADELLS